MHHPYCLPLWCATLLLVVAATGVRAQVDPKALLQKQFETIARGDVAGRWPCIRMMRSSTGRVCVAAPCVGKAAIQKEFEHRIANKVHATGLNYYVDGTVVTARYAVQSNSTQQAGVDRIIGWKIVELKAGKIGATRGPVWERTDAQTARYLEWQRTQPATR